MPNERLHRMLHKLYRRLCLRHPTMPCTRICFRGQYQGRDYGSALRKPVMPVVLQLEVPSKSMTSMRYRFQIPDPTKLLPGPVPPWGPTCELVDFKPQTLTAEKLVGRTIDEICTIVGTYGMGGPGFFGLRLGDEWLVISIWGAASWVQVDGRIVQDVFWDKNGWPRPWITKDHNELDEVLVGQVITSFEVTKNSLTIGISGRTLSITESPKSRPIHEGSKQPRSFEQGDDLRRVIFLAPTTELWIS